MLVLRWMLALVGKSADKATVATTTKMANGKMANGLWDLIDGGGIVGALHGLVVVESRRRRLILLAPLHDDLVDDHAAQCKQGNGCFDVVINVLWIPIIVRDRIAGVGGLAFQPHHRGRE